MWLACSALHGQHCLYYSYLTAPGRRTSTTLVIALRQNHLRRSLDFCMARLAVGTTPSDVAPIVEKHFLQLEGAACGFGITWHPSSQSQSCRAGKSPKRHLCIKIQGTSVTDYSQKNAALNVCRQTDRRILCGDPMFAAVQEPRPDGVPQACTTVNMVININWSLGVRRVLSDHLED